MTPSSRSPCGTVVHEVIQNTAMLCEYKSREDFGVCLVLAISQIHRDNSMPGSLADCRLPNTALTQAHYSDPTWRKNTPVCTVTLMLRPN